MAEVFATATVKNHESNNSCGREYRAKTRNPGSSEPGFLV
jgi:hypothetical protein